MLVSEHFTHRLHGWDPLPSQRLFCGLDVYPQVWVVSIYPHVTAHRMQPGFHVDLVIISLFFFSSSFTLTYSAYDFKCGYRCFCVCDGHVLYSFSFVPSTMFLGSIYVTVLKSSLLFLALDLYCILWWNNFMKIFHVIKYLQEHHSNQDIINMF